MSQHELDRRLREALDPEAETVERVARRALGPPRPRPALHLWVLPAAVAAVLAVGAAVLFVGDLVLTVPAPDPVVAEPDAVAAFEPSAVVTNVGGLVVVRRPDGGGSIIGSTPAPNGAEPHQLLIAPRRSTPHP